MIKSESNFRAIENKHIAYHITQSLGLNNASNNTVNLGTWFWIVNFIYIYILQLQLKMSPLTQEIFENFSNYFYVSIAE